MRGQPHPKNLKKQKKKKKSNPDITLDFLIFSESSIFYMLPPKRAISSIIVNFRKMSAASKKSRGGCKNYSQVGNFILYNSISRCHLIWNRPGRGDILTRIKHLLSILFLVIITMIYMRYWYPFTWAKC